MKNSTKKQILFIATAAFLLVATFMLIGFASYNQTASAYAKDYITETEYSIDSVTGESYDIRINRTVCITENFCDSTIIVTLRRAYSVPNSDLLLPTTNVLATANSHSSGFCYSMIYSIEDLTYFTSEALAMDILSSRSLPKGNANFNQIFALQLREAGKQNVLDAIYHLEQLDKVLAAEPSFTSHGVVALCDSVQQDSVVKSLANTFTQGDFWGLNRVNVAGAHRIASTKGAGIYVGVMDRGGVLNHASLGSRNQATNIFAWNRHPLQVAGVIAGANSGVAPRANIVSLDWRSGRYFVNSITYARNRGVRIINTSFIWVDDDRGRLYEASSASANAIANFPGVFVAGAGNFNDELKNRPFRYPAAYTAIAGINNMIVVGASNIVNSRSHSGDGTVNQWGGLGTSWCRDNVDLFAPGANILTTFPEHLCDGRIEPTTRFRQCEVERDFNLHIYVRTSVHHSNGYHFTTGTSFAAPMVAGTVALMLSVNPNLAPSQIKQIIRDTVSPSSSLRYFSYSGGVLNAYRAVRSALLTPGVGQYRTDFLAPGRYTAGKANHYFINRWIGSSYNAYIAIPNILVHSQALFPNQTITGASLRFNFDTRGGQSGNLRAAIICTASPSGLHNSSRLMDLTVSQTNLSSGVATIDIFNHLNIFATNPHRDPNRGIGIISLWVDRQSGWPCGHTVNFYNVELVFGFLEFSTILRTTPVSGGLRIDGFVSGFTTPVDMTLHIPSSINGQPVTRIAINAFRDSRLTSVSIPSTITHIGYSAFRHSSLSQITFAVNSQLRYIGEVAFGWTHLTSIQIPAGVVRLENSTFLRSPNLTTVTFAPGSQLRYIYCWVFRETNLTTLEIPPLLTRIQCGTLDYVNPNLTVVLQQGRTHIADGLFRDKPVINIVIPNGVTHIGANAFRGAHVRNVSIPHTITHIGYSAFRHSNLSQITFTANSQLRYIGEVAFGWTQLTSIQIPAGVVRLENSTFLRSPNLTTVTFAPGSQLRYIYCWVFRETNLTTLEIPPLLTRIQCGTLDYVNPNLTIVLQAGRTSISDSLFRGTSFTNLRTIVNNNTAVQQVNNTTFGNIDRSAIRVYIPIGTYAAYRAAGWHTFILVQR